MSTPLPMRKSIGHECKHALYFTATDKTQNDCLVVKEWEHYDDGTKVPRLLFVKNYPREFWVTRKEMRNHKDKKEWEKKSRLQSMKSPQIKLVEAVGRALERPGLKGNLRMVARSPYVYGFDVTTPVLIKHEYMEKWPELHARGKNLVAVLDIETDMIKPTNHPEHSKMIMGSLTMGHRARIIILESFLEGIVDPETKIQAAFEEYLGEYKQKRGIKLEVDFAKTPGEAAYKLIMTAHEWQPDILTIWNMNFDIPRIVKMLEAEGYNLADVFSDPRCPPEFRYFEYIEGAPQKVTQSGKVLPLHPAERWHVVECPASFYILDAMCVYLKIRIAAGKEASYSLDYILQKILGIRKLKFKEADQYVGGKWHTFMQQFHKIAYCIYNLFDCISTEELDEKTTDLNQMISLLCGHSEYHRFPSQPRRTCDDLHFFCLERGLVAATTSDQMKDELDDHVVSINDWIVTLPSYLVSDDGICALEELPNVRTLMRAHVADLDVEGTYPNVEILANISKETTSKELCKIEGVDELTQRSIGINLSGGFVNAVEICCQVYKAPTMDTLLETFRRKHLSGLPQHTVTVPTMSIETRESVQQMASDVLNLIGNVGATEGEGYQMVEPTVSAPAAPVVDEARAGLITELVSILYANDLSDEEVAFQTYAEDLAHSEDDLRRWVQLRVGSVAANTDGTGLDALMEGGGYDSKALADLTAEEKARMETRRAQLTDVVDRQTTISLERQYLWDRGIHDRDEQLIAFANRTDVTGEDIRQWVDQQVHGGRGRLSEWERQIALAALEKELIDAGAGDSVEAFRVVAADPSVPVQSLKAWTADKIFETMLSGGDEVEGQEADECIADFADLIRTERGEAAAEAFEEAIGAEPNLNTMEKVETFINTYREQIGI